MIPRARAAGTSRQSNHIAFSRRPLALRPRQPFPQRGLFAGRYPVLPRDSAAFSPRCDLTPRSHLGRRVRGGPFILGSVTRAGLLNFDTPRQPGVA